MCFLLIVELSNKVQGCKLIVCASLLLLLYPHCSSGLCRVFCCFYFAPRLTFCLWLFCRAKSEETTLKNVGCEISSSAHIPDCPIRIAVFLSQA